jgi:hypothetical protein
MLASMSQKVHDWIAARIEESRPGNPDVNVVTQLCDAAASLRGQGSGQVFGMQVDAASVTGASDLADRALAVVTEWLPTLTTDQHAAIGSVLAKLGLPAVGGAVAPLPKRVVSKLLVWTKAEVVDIDTSAVITDPTIIARFEGARPSSDLGDPLCLVDATEGDDGFWIGGDAELVLDHARTGLRCLLTLDLARVPTTEQVNRLLGVIENDLFFTGWGLNLDWEVEDQDGLENVSVSVDVKPVQHRLDRTDS